MTAEEKRVKHAAYMREWKRINPDKVNAINRAVKAKDPERYRRINRESIRRMREADPERFKEINRRSRKANQEKRQKATIAWVINHPGYYMLKNAQYRAKKLGLPFDLTFEDVQIPEICPVLGIPLVSKEGRHGFLDNSPSLDRIIPALGYVRGNVRVISNRANTIKRDATMTELEAIVAYLKRELG